MLKMAAVPLLMLASSASLALAQDFSRTLPYKGRKLEGEVFLCTSDHVVGGSFRRDAVTQEVTEDAAVSTERAKSTWRITLKGSKADVVAFTGATQTLETAEEFVVYRREKSVLLTRQDRSLTGTPGVQTITIDLSSSSFVYSGHGVFDSKNGVNVFLGSCRTYM